MIRPIRHWLLALCGGVAAASLSLPAQANVMTFSSIPQGFFGDPFVGASYTEDGIKLTQPQGFIAGLTGGGNPGGYFSNPNFLGAQEIITLVGGGLFDLISIDVKMWSGGNANQLFTGHLSGGGTVSTTQTAFGGFSWVTVTFDSSWTGLTSVEWIWNNVSFDNIVVQETAAAAVPEPATLAIFGLVLAGMGLIRRKFVA